MKILLPVLLLMFSLSSAMGQSANTKTQSKSVTVNKTEATAKGSKGGGATANKSGSEIKNSKGGGVEAKKGEVAAKKSNGNGAEVNKKGVDVKGKNGGMVIDKKKLEIKSKKFNVKLGGG